MSLIWPFSIKFQAWIDSLPSYASNETAVAALGVNKPYKAAAGHAAASVGQLMWTV